MVVLTGLLEGTGRKLDNERREVSVAEDDQQYSFRMAKDVRPRLLELALWTGMTQKDILTMLVRTFYDENHERLRKAHEEQRDVWIHGSISSSKVHIAGENRFGMEPEP